MKNLYVIYDTVSKEFGEVLSFSGFPEAKRSFIYACASTPTFKDLELFHIGEIKLASFENYSNKDESKKTVFVPVLTQLDYTSIDDENEVNFDAVTPVCCGFEVQEEVQKIIEENLLKMKMQSSIASMFHSKEFVDNVQKLCRYFSKNDKKRFR